MAAVHDAGCFCGDCRPRCAVENCDAVLGAPGDTAEHCATCARAIRDLDRESSQLSRFASLTLLGHAPDRAAELVRSGEAERVIRDATDPSSAS